MGKQFSARPVGAKYGIYDRKNFQLVDRAYDTEQEAVERAALFNLGTKRRQADRVAKRIESRLGFQKFLDAKAVKTDEGQKAINERIAQLEARKKRVQTLAYQFI